MTDSTDEENMQSLIKELLSKTFTVRIDGGKKFKQKCKLYGPFTVIPVLNNKHCTLFAPHFKVAVKQLDTKTLIVYKSFIPGYVHSIHLKTSSFEFAKLWAEKFQEYKVTVRSFRPPSMIFYVKLIDLSDNSKVFDATLSFSDMLRVTAENLQLEYERSEIVAYASLEDPNTIIATRHSEVILKLQTNDREHLKQIILCFYDGSPLPQIVKESHKSETSDLPVKKLIPKTPSYVSGIRHFNAAALNPHFSSTFSASIQEPVAPPEFDVKPTINWGKSEISPKKSRHSKKSQSMPDLKLESMEEETNEIPTSEISFDRPLLDFKRFPTYNELYTGVLSLYKKKFFGSEDDIPKCPEVNITSSELYQEYLEDSHPIFKWKSEHLKHAITSLSADINSPNIINQELSDSENESENSTNVSQNHSRSPSITSLTECSEEIISISLLDITPKRKDEALRFLHQEEINPTHYFISSIPGSSDNYPSVQQFISEVHNSESDPNYQALLLSSLLIQGRLKSIEKIYNDLKSLEFPCVEITECIMKHPFSNMRSCIKFFISIFKIQCVKIFLRSLHIHESFTSSNYNADALIRCPNICLELSKNNFSPNISPLALNDAEKKQKHEQESQLDPKFIIQEDESKFYQLPETFSFHKLFRPDIILTHSRTQINKQFSLLWIENAVPYSPFSSIFLTIALALNNDKSAYPRPSIGSIINNTESILKLNTKHALKKSLSKMKKSKSKSNTSLNKILEGDSDSDEQRLVFDENNEGNDNSLFQDVDIPSRSVIDNTQSLHEGNDQIEVERLNEIQNEEEETIENQILTGNDMLPVPNDFLKNLRKIFEKNDKPTSSSVKKYIGIMVDLILHKYLAIFYMVYQHFIKDGEETPYENSLLSPDAEIELVAELRKFENMFQEDQIKDRKSFVNQSVKDFTHTIKELIL